MKKRFIYIILALVMILPQIAGAAIVNVKGPYNKLYSVDTDGGKDNAAYLAGLAASGIDPGGKVVVGNQLGSGGKKTTIGYSACNTSTNTKIKTIQVKIFAPGKKTKVIVSKTTVPCDAGPKINPNPNCVGLGCNGTTNNNGTNPTIGGCTQDVWTCSGFSGTCPASAVRNQTCTLTTINKASGCTTVTKPSETQSCTPGVLDENCTIHDSVTGQCLTPEIKVFRAVPSLISKGGQCTLSWETEDATDCTITSKEPTISIGSGKIPNGSVQTTALNETTQYTLVCNNGATPSLPKKATCNVQDVTEN